MARTISLQGSDLAASETAKMRECTFKDDQGASKTVKVLATEAMSIGGGGEGIPDGTADNNILQWDAATSAWVEIGPYVEIDVVLFTGDRKITGKMLFKASSADVGYISSHERKLLQVKAVTGENATTTYQLGIDYGYLAEDGDL